jgi:hypothetical protein
MDKVVVSDAFGRIRGYTDPPAEAFPAGPARDRRGPARHFPLARLMLQVITT